MLSQNVTQQICGKMLLSCHATAIPWVGMIDRMEIEERRLRKMRLHGQSHSTLEGFLHPYAACRGIWTPCSVCRLDFHVDMLPKPELWCSDFPSLFSFANVPMKTGETSSTLVVII